MGSLQTVWKRATSTRASRCWARGERWGAVVRTAKPDTSDARLVGAALALVVLGLVVRELVVSIQAGTLHGTASGRWGWWRLSKHASRTHGR